MVVRNFSPAGGLELYAHKVVEGLLERGAHITVLCQQIETELKHENLVVKSIMQRPDNAKKAARLHHDYQAGNQALLEAGTFDIIHSQHYPVGKADVVTFHNHAVMRWSEVGLDWEKLINEIKFRFAAAYKLRDQQDHILCSSANCLIFPSRIMREDYYDSYQFLKTSNKPCVIAYPGSTLLRGTEDLQLEPDDNQPQHSKEERVDSSQGFGAGSKFVFLFVGRGYRRKGLDILLSACRILASKRFDFRLFIAGLNAKPLDQARLQFLGLTEQVRYLGFQQNMEKVYALADVAILPSRIEPFGMAPLQAMESGLVPIVSRVSGASEVLQHGIDSLILENHLDAHELANLMQRLMDDPALVSKLKTGAKRTASKVNWDQTVENTWQAYQLAINYRKFGLQLT